jgi:hypothetical protein
MSWVSLKSFIDLVASDVRNFFLMVAIKLLSETHGFVTYRAGFGKEGLVTYRYKDLFLLENNIRRGLKGPVFVFLLAKDFLVCGLSEIVASSPTVTFCKQKGDIGVLF